MAEAVQGLFLLLDRRGDLDGPGPREKCFIFDDQLRRFEIPIGKQNSSLVAKAGIDRHVRVEEGRAIPLDANLGSSLRIELADHG